MKLEKNIILFANRLFVRGNKIYVLSLFFVFLIAAFEVYALRLLDQSSLAPALCIIICSMFDLIRFQNADFLDLHYFTNVPISLVRKIHLFLLSEIFNLKLFVCTVSLIFVFWDNSGTLQAQRWVLSGLFIIAYTSINSTLILLSRRFLTAGRIYRIIHSLLSLLFFFQVFSAVLDFPGNDLILQETLLGKVAFALDGLTTPSTALFTIFCLLLYFYISKELIVKFPFQKESIISRNRSYNI